MKTSSRHFFGIDLGTSSCSIAYATDDPRRRDARTVDVRTVDVAVETGGAHLITNRIPSIVAAPLDPKGRGGALFGLDFLAAFGRKKKEAVLLRRDRDYFSSVKSDLGTLRVYTRSRVPGCRTASEVTAVILERLRGLAHDANPALDPRKAPVVITVPASFSALARTETLDAAVKSGFDRANVRLLDEPVAALLDLLNSAEAATVLDAQPRNLLVFDYGAGTCDVALLRVRFDPAADTGLHVENLAISNYHRLGGDDVDARVMEHVVWPQICSDEQRWRSFRVAPPRDRGHAHRHRGAPAQGRNVPRRREEAPRVVVGGGRREPGTGPGRARAAFRRSGARERKRPGGSRWTPRSSPR